jgi:hypothetical protein
MPSTYTLNNGIELIGTGEQSGTWGATTNTNLGLLDAALDGQVTVALASAGSSGSPNSLPITDGTASNGRNRMVVFSDSGDLGATAYVQLTPNDAEKIIYIRNSLSGSRSVILFQGTYNASNDYEVPAGTTAVVYFDGAGAGAVAANVFNNAYFDGLRLGSVSVTAILDEDNMASDSAAALATQQSIKAYVDSQVGTVDTLAEILAIGNTTGGTDIVASTTDKVQFRDAAIYINSSVDGQLDIVADTEIQIAATTVDVNGALDVSGTALVTGVLTTTAATVSNGGGQFNGAINVGVDDTGYDVKFFGATAGAYMLWDESADDLILSGAAGLSVNSTALVTGVLTTTAATVFNGGFASNAASTITTADNTDTLTLISTDADANAGPNLRMYRNSGSPSAADVLGVIDYEGRNDSSEDVIYVNITAQANDVSNGSEDGSYYISTMFGGTLRNRMNVLPTETVFNQESLDLDFRVESDTDANALFVQGSDGNVGIGMGSPSLPLHVNSTTSGLPVTSGTTQTNGVFRLSSSATSGIIDFGMNGGSPWIQATDYTGLNNNYNLLLNPNGGNVGIGMSSPQAKLQVLDQLKISSADQSQGNVMLGDGSSTTFNVGIARWNGSTNAAGTGGVGYFSQGSGNLGGHYFYTGDAAAGSTTERMRINTSGGLITNPAAGGHAVFNEGGVDADFRVESDANTHALFVDAGSGFVGVNTAEQTQGGTLNVGMVSASAVVSLLSRSATDGHTGILLFMKTPATSGNYTATADGDVLGDIRFSGVNTSLAADIGAQITVTQSGTASTTVPADMVFVTNEIQRLAIQGRASGGEVIFNDNSADCDFRVESDGNANMLFVDAGSNVLGVGTNAPTGFVGIRTTAVNYSSGVFNKPHIALQAEGDPDDDDGFVGITYATSSSDNYGWSGGAERRSGGVGEFVLTYHSNSATGTERTRWNLDGFIIQQTGAVINESGADADFRVETDNESHAFFVDASAERITFFKTGDAFNEDYGAIFYQGGAEHKVTNGDAGLSLNRVNSDGNLIQFYTTPSEGGTATNQGNISVSGSTVTYGGGHLGRWSRLPDNSVNPNLLKGTVMTNLDAMVVWEGEENEQLNQMEISSVESDPNVSGVFVSWDFEDDGYNDMTIAMTGDMIIRIAQGTTVARGDLLMSAGDGTAKPQGDDIVRGKTIAKITSTHVTCTYDDGSYCVPCVLMAC